MKLQMPHLCLRLQPPCTQQSRIFIVFRPSVDAWWRRGQQDAGAQRVQLAAQLTQRRQPEHVGAAAAADDATEDVAVDAEDDAATSQLYGQGGGQATHNTQ